MKILFVAILMAIGSGAFADTTTIIREPDFELSKVMQSKVPVKGIAGYSKNRLPIEAYYFPGKSEKRALIIGGVHGSELSAIEVAKAAVAQLMSDPTNYYTVIIIPCLFPDNTVMAAQKPSLIGSTDNIGRYSHAGSPDPNRQMPSLGTAFNEYYPVDHAGRMIEQENQLLLRIIQQFKPERIANLHAIRAIDQAGVYADPRTDHRGFALEYESDSSLAISMALYIEQNGGDAPGNKVYKDPSTLYHTDPHVAAPGEKQPRNLHGSRLPNNRGYGVSLGSWASTAVSDPANPKYDREAIRLLTVEFPGCRRAEDYSNPAKRQYYREQTAAYAGALTNVFLGDTL
jgi:hypothetical protein